MVKKYWGLRGKGLNAAVWGMACLCVMIFGFNQAVAGGVLTTTAFQRQFPQIDTINTTGAKQHYNSTIQGTVIALYTLTGTFGALACTFLGDVWGRRWTIFTACAVNMVGVILMGTSFQFAQFIVARIVLGLGTGGVIATTSVWQAELSKPQSRGEHVSAFGVFCGMGLLVALWIAFGCHFTDSSFAWRFPFLIQLFLPVSVMSFIHTLPESPRWLVKMRRVDQAEEIFSIIYEAPANSQVVRSLIRDCQLSIELAESTNLSALFKMGKQRVLHRVILAAIAQMYLQMSGVNSITFYASTIFQEYLHFSTSIAQILAACSQFVVILGGLMCSFTVDRFGRRTNMMLGSAGMCMCQVALTGLLSNPGNNKGLLDAAAFFTFFYYIFYALGWFGIPFLYASEVAPINLRAAVCGISTAVSWLFNFIVAEITPVAFNTIGYRYFIVYACINASAIVVVFFFFPETNGRSLEEIDEIFVRSKSIFDPVRVAKQMPRQALSEFLVDEGKLDATAMQIENLENGVTEKTIDDHDGA